MADEVGKSETAKREEEILAFWKHEKIFEKSLAKPAPKGEFVFYDGPPFATGLPHSGSLLSSVSKDLIPRYKTMRGYRVRRRWGWDTHGLPIESLVEKKLGLKTKKDILALGVETFNETARSMVLGYVEEWRRYVERVGRWVDFDNSYKTMDASFTESVWWGLKQIHNKGRLFEGRRVLMYCPHDETPLAKAEIAMDNTYKDVTEEAVTVKFKVKNPEKHGLPANTFILAWTTTPWTLPGNVALAVGKDIEYGIVEMDGEHLLLAKVLAPAVLSQKSSGPAHGSGQTFAQELPASALVGLEYEPLFDVPKIESAVGKKYIVLPADFVTTDDGTGIVHTAVMYGEDDFALGQKEGLPMVQLLTAGAVFTDDAPPLVRGHYYKKAEAPIKEDLERRGLLYKKEMHTHSYPHCYRCGSPLIYNAVPSWFIDIQSVKRRMLAENKKITWMPEHLKQGRFKNIVENAPDWTISRNRFWASPLPIWKDKDGKVTVIGSLEELKKHTKKSGNRYFVMRHGEAEHNIQGIVNVDRSKNFHLTEKGAHEVQDGVKAFSGTVDHIFASPFMRTRESAEIAAESFGVPRESIIYDDRLHEFSFGDLDGKSLDEFYAWRSKSGFTDRMPGGECYQDAKKRFGDFLYELEHTYHNKRILIVTHGIGLEILPGVVRGTGPQESKRLVESAAVPHGVITEIPFVPLPHNRNYELDYHLPYIDEIELVDEKGEKLTRTPEVVDCWVESGSMPFAEYHYPVENKAVFEHRSPGDFISEYIGQTRAWFYYLHAISVSIFGHRAFNNVTVTGNVLAGDGAKFSKSKGNYTDPYLLFDRYGADAFRYYLMSSVVMQAEDFMFRDEDLKEVHNRVVNILRNTLAFYVLYMSDAPAPSASSKHVLDRWIVARLSEITRSTTQAFDSFDTVRATRPWRGFIEDFSTWYVRRSRDRMRDGEQGALATMRHVLREFSKLIAPVMPYVADEIFHTVRTESDPESVHLAEWTRQPFFKPPASSSKLLSEMATVRNICSHALEARQNAGIKVRQPLQKLTADTKKLNAQFLELIKDEVNVKHVVNGDFALDTTLTEELKKEGQERDAIRAVQDMRKSAGLTPRDAAVLVLSAVDRDLYETHREALMKGANITRIESGETTYVKSA